MEKVAGESIFLVATCPTCDELRYRSRTAIKDVADCRADNFMALGDAPPPTDGQPPLCHRCQAVLVFSAETESGIKLEAPTAAVPHEEPVPLPPRPIGGLRSSHSRTLFRVADGEEIKNLATFGTRYIVTTNKRIEEINIGSD